MSKEKTFEGQLAETINFLESKLSDLEAKLAESESNVKIGEFWHSAYQGKQLDYDKVYAELRKSYNEVEELKQQLHQIYSHLGVEAFCEDIHEQALKEIGRLQQQLAEKEREISNLKNIVNGIDKLEQYDKDAKQIILINPDNIYADGYKLVIKQDNQDKISFCIEKLEQVRTQFQTKYSWYEETHRVCEKTDDFVIWLDNQIEQLKKEMEEYE